MPNLCKAVGTGPADSEEIFEDVDPEDICSECFAFARKVVAFDAALLLLLFSGTSSKPFLEDFGESLPVGDVSELSALILGNNDDGADGDVGVASEVSREGLFAAPNILFNRPPSLENLLSLLFPASLSVLFSACERWDQVTLLLPLSFEGINVCNDLK